MIFKAPSDSNHSMILYVALSYRAPDLFSSSLIRDMPSEELIYISFKIDIYCTYF